MEEDREWNRDEAERRGSFEEGPRSRVALDGYRLDAAE